MTVLTNNRADQEIMLFAILLECVKQQILALDNRFQHKAKQWVKILLQTGDSTLKELYKNLDPDSENALGEMYDYMYMMNRRAAEVDVENVELFSEIMKQLVESQKMANEAGISLKQYLLQNPFVL